MPPRNAAPQAVAWATMLTRSITSSLVHARPRPLPPPCTGDRRWISSTRPVWNLSRPPPGYPDRRESSPLPGRRASHATPAPQSPYHAAPVPEHYRLLSGLNTGDEPGIDVQSEHDQQLYGDLTEPSTVTIVDYSSNPKGTNVRVDMDGSRLPQWLNKYGRRPDDGGRGVRWIHVTGLNWEVVKTLGVHYHFHPLAVEDTLHSSRSPRSKIDFYSDQLYLQIVVQLMRDSDRQALESAAGNDDDDLDSRMSIIMRDLDGPFQRDGDRTLGTAHDLAETAANRLVIDHLSAAYVVPVRKGILSVFLLPDNTVVSLCEHELSQVVDPIHRRLQDERSQLRRSGDPSLLIHALLDVSVDLCVEISNAFEAKILTAEASVLVHPKVDLVRGLHVISAQIIRFKRQILSLLHVGLVIRDEDVRRTQAVLAARAAAESSNPEMATPRLSGWPTQVPDHSMSEHLSPEQQAREHVLLGLPTAPGSITPPSAGSTRTGYFTPLSKVYMSDVIDHLETMLSLSDQYVSMCNHLTSHVFNVLSFNTNMSMERLSIVTVVFLPLTFIASYFGMNFTEFPALNNDEGHFWMIAAPATVTFFFIFSYGYIRTAAQTLFRRVSRRRAWQQKVLLQWLRTSRRRPIGKDW